MFNNKQLEKDTQMLKSDIEDISSSLKNHRQVIETLLDYLGLHAKYSKVVEFGCDENCNFGDKIVEKCEIVKNTKEKKSDVKKNKKIIKNKKNK